MKSEELRRLTIKSFAVGGLCAVLALVAWFWLRGQPQDGGIPWALRQVHELNGRLWSKVFSHDRTPPTLGAAAGTKPRVNGLLGLEKPIDQRLWRLQVFAEDKLVQTLPLSGLKLLPLTNTATQFYCIEGWSTRFSYSGVKFSDFMKAFGLATTYRYVGLETPDHLYYVSIDMDSMMHPMTLLALEMNERPLSTENGAPLRLIIPVKYGIKSLKRIGAIRFSNTRPPDYWAERGYDWYSGL